MNKIAIVTGGAKGIGKAIVEMLYNNGYKVVLNYNTSKKEAENLKQELDNRNDIILYKADVSNREEINNMISYCLETFGDISVLVNNAGISEVKMFQDITVEDWDKMIRTNLTGVFNVTQEVIKTMIKNKLGVIINISSIWGITGGALETHYSASKAGVIGLTKALAKELRTI